MSSRKLQKKTESGFGGCFRLKGEGTVRPCARRAWAQRPATA